MKSRIMFIDCKTGQLNGFGRIGRVTYSKSGATLHYKGQSFRKVRYGYKYNCYDIETGERYWISGPKKRGGDRLYGAPGTPIDDDVRIEYWTTIRRQPERSKETRT